MSGRAVDTSNSGSGGPGFKPSPSRCFHRQGTLLHFVSLHPGVEMGTGDILLGGGGEGGVNLRWNSIPSRGGVAILLGNFMLRKPVQDPAVWAFGTCTPLPFTSLFAAITVVGVMKLQTQCVVVGSKDQKITDFL